jgi:hypothetical protein
MRYTMRAILLGLLVAAALAAGGAAQGNGTSSPQRNARAEKPARTMSPMGRRAHRLVAALNQKAAAATARFAKPPEPGDDDEEGGPGPLEDGGALPGGNQGELSIAIDDTGQHIVLGFNDARGFSLNPVRVSGFMWSDDGGQTFTDGGQLPVTTGTVDLGGMLLPQVFGDPDVKYLGACNFIFSSILVAPFGSSSSVQTMGFHRSTDCGHTWEGPFEVGPATNPNGLVDANGDPFDAADKEQLDVNRMTGRVMMTWTNFSEAVEISSTYSDNVLAATPVWSPRLILGAREEDGQASVPRFGPNRSNLVYVAWMTQFDGLTGGISVARSTDGGVSFQPPIDIDPGFFVPDYVLGNDRIHWFPTLAVDRSLGPHRGTVYVAYAQNNAHDGGDIVVQRSVDQGRSFLRPTFVTARPGADRSQWFPWITVNDRTGRVLLFYYDQSVADSGDLTQVSYTFSDDGGRTWAAQRPLSRTPFHAGWGNDTGQPNLGDYNQSVVDRGGDLLAAYAVTHEVGFRDGQPSRSMTVPEPTMSRVRLAAQAPITTVDLRSVTVTDRPGSSNNNGFLDRGEIGQVDFAIRNYVTNPLNARTLIAPVAFVQSLTPKATVLVGVTAFPTLSPGASASSLSPILLRLNPSFVSGDDVTLQITVLALGGLPMRLQTTLHTGTPLATTLINEPFNVAPGSLPAGWSAVHGAGANTVPWTTRAGFCGSTSNGAFHTNANDGASPFNNARWERLFSPTVTIPADSQWAEVELDVCTDTEDDPNFNVLAYDGAFLRVFDATPGDSTRSVLAEAFASDFMTGSLFHYPKHFPRNSDPAYFEDMSVWAGDSGGLQHVKIRLVGLAGTTVQLRFEFAQDEFGTCADVRPGHSCGVLIDNVKFTSFTAR